MHSIDRLNKYLDLKPEELARVAYRKFVELTPVRSGNARRSTRLIGNEIQASYPYAGRLDNGYSRQAIRGMSEPTMDYMEQYVKNKLG